MAGIENVILTDSVGTLTVTALEPVPTASIDDRPYFRAVRDGPAARPSCRTPSWVAFRANGA